MRTNFLMLKDLLAQYTPKTKGIINHNEYYLIESALCLNEMDILQLKNMRDFTVAHLGRSDDMIDWDRMSAIVYVIDNYIIEVGGEV